MDDARETATTQDRPLDQGLGRELGSSALLLGLSFAVTAVVVTSAQAVAALLG